jgi:hypothetical protein
MGQMSGLAELTLAPQLYVAASRRRPQQSAAAASAAGRTRRGCGFLPSAFARIYGRRAALALAAPAGRPRPRRLGRSHAGHLRGQEPWLAWPRASELAVDPPKQEMLRKMASAYLRQIPEIHRAAVLPRFDVLSVYFDGDGPVFEHRRDAFPRHESSWRGR